MEDVLQKGGESVNQRPGGSGIDGGAGSSNVHGTAEPVGEAVARSVELARHAEQWGYRRYWLAEHHVIAGLAFQSGNPATN